MPVYNAEKYITRCLDSILQGTKISYEINCVDDGSRDGSSEIIKQYQKHHPQVILVTLKENQGLYLARLSGIKLAKGKYLGFVDSDDYVSVGYFDHLYERILHEHTDIAVGTIINVNEQGIKYIQTRCETFPYLNYNEKDGRIYALYWEQSGKCYHWQVLWNKLYKRELWEKALPVLMQQSEHLVMLEDFIYSSIVLSLAETYAVSKDAYYFYEAHGDAVTRGNKYLQIKKI